MLTFTTTLAKYHLVYVSNLEERLHKSPCALSNYMDPQLKRGWMIYFE